MAVVSLNGFAQYGAQNWIDKNGGDSKTVKFVQLAAVQPLIDITAKYGGFSSFPASEIIYRS